MQLSRTQRSAPLAELFCRPGGQNRGVGGTTRLVRSGRRFRAGPIAECLAGMLASVLSAALCRDARYPEDL